MAFWLVLLPSLHAPAANTPQTLPTRITKLTVGFYSTLYTCRTPCGGLALGMREAKLAKKGEKQ